MNENSKNSEIKEHMSLEKELEMDGDDGDTLYQEEIRTLQQESDVQRLSSRMTFLFILIPTLLCAVFAFVYIDLRGRLKDTESVGAKEVKNVVGRMTSVSEQYKALEEALGGRISALEKGSKKAEDALEKKIKDLHASKMDKKGVRSATKKVTDDMALRFTGLEKELALQKASVDELAKKFEKELDEGANAAATFQSDLRMQAEQVAEVTQTLERMQKKDLELDLGIRRLFDDRDAWNQEIDAEKKATTELRKRLEALAEEIDWIEKKLELEREKEAIPEAPQAKPQEEKAPQQPPSGGEGSGSIIEQDIKQ